MTAARYDITVDQGSDFALELIVKESGNAKNFSDDDTAGSEKRWGARASFRKTLELPIVGSFSTTVTRDSQGKITLELDGITSAAIAAGTYLYDLEVYQFDYTQQAQDDLADDGIAPTEFSVTRLLGGNVSIRREVTR